MSFFMEKEEHFIIIVGCGYLGVTLADSLISQEIVIIDNKEDAFSRLPLSFKGAGIIGDAVEIFIMNEIHIEKAAAVISATGDDNTNILVAHIAKSFYHIPYVTASLHAMERERICRELDIGIILPDRITATAINDYLRATVNAKG